MSDHVLKPLRDASSLEGAYAGRFRAALATSMAAISPVIPSRLGEHAFRMPLLGATALLAPAAVIVAFGDLSYDDRYVLHFAAVAVTMVVAVAAALGLTVAGVRRADARAVAVGVAFSAMGALLLVHGLATPEIIVPGEESGLIAFAGAATLPVGAALLCLVGSPLLRRPGAVRLLLVLQAALIVGIVVLGAVGLVFPRLVPSEPAPWSPPALGLLAVATVLFGALASRVRRTFRLTRRPGDLWAFVGVGWLATALFAALLDAPWSVGWWSSHVLETLGMLALGVPVVLDLRHAAPSRPLAGDLRASELVVEEEQLLGPQVHALMVRLAVKDVSTEEHTRRVALLAVQVGEALGLAPVALRRLAVGGLLHDIGKLKVRDDVLKKPGRLTDEEFAVIRCHPAWGDELAASLGFPPAVRVLVRSHHERLDGRGYPDNLTADLLPREVRILTVCDVYDALVSDRVYRDALEHDRAIGILMSEQGTAFDPACVAALQMVLESSGVERERLRSAA